MSTTRKQGGSVPPQKMFETFKPKDINAMLCFLKNPYEKLQFALLQAFLMGGGIFLLPGFLKSLKVKSADNVSYLNADTSWSNKELTDKFEKTIYFRVGSEKYL